MENVIKMVIESEYRAQRIISEVEEERRLAALNIEKKIRQLKEDTLCAIREKAARVKAENDRYAREEAAKILEEARNKASLMREEFARNRDAWVHCLTDAILGR